MKQSNSRTVFSSPVIWALALIAAAGCDETGVTVVEVNRIEVSPPAATVLVNGTTQLAATLLSSSGVPLAGRSIAWVSLDSTVARVDAAGVVRGVGPGSAQIQATAEGATGSALVSVVLRQPVIAVDPASLSFTGSQGAPNPAARTVAVTEAEGAPLPGLTAEVAYPTGQPSGWVIASLGSTTAPASLTVGVATGTLTPGTYTATLRVGAPGAANTPRSIPIEFVVQPQAPTIRVSPAAVTLATAPNGANPAPAQVDITNVGSGSLTGLARTITYTAGQPTGWLTAQLAGTTAPTTLTLTATRGSLPVGTYSATVSIASGTAANSPVDVAVSFTVGNAPPGSPGSIQATTVSASQIDVSWAAAAGTVAGYRIERRTGSGTFALVDSVAGTVLSYSSTGLAPATAYTFRVQACNSAGCSPFSGEASATTGLGAPGAPTGLQAVPVSTSRIDLTWTASTGTVDRYRIERATSSGPFALIDSVGGATVSYTDTGLSAGTVYSYRVHACNAGGCSAPSNTAAATTGTAPPSAPSSLQASAVSPTRINLSWSASSGSNQSYRVERRTGSGGYSLLTTVSAGTLTYADMSVSGGTAYTYRVQACSLGGCSGYSNEATATTPVGPPGAPSGLAATPVSSSRIDLAWSAPQGTVGSYRIERATAGGTFALIDSVGGTTLSYSDTGLTPGTAYTYRVQACSAAGCSGFSNTASATTTAAPPGPPSGLAATSSGLTTIDLAWSAAPGTVDSYRIERALGNGAFALIGTVAGTTLAYSDALLLPATTYRYRVQACNTAGCSTYSNTASATTAVTPPGAPSGLQATTASSSRINLAWTAATGTVDTYRVERSTAGGAFELVGTVAGDVRSAADTGLAKGTLYTYRVQACNAGGCSAYSNEASATTAGSG